MMLDVCNPATGEHLSSVEVFSANDISAAAERAAEAAKSWEHTAPSVRAVKLVNAASLIRSRQDALSALLTREQGKPLAEARSEIQGAAHVFEYYASVCGSISILLIIFKICSLPKKFSFVLLIFCRHSLSSLRLPTK